MKFKILPTAVFIGIILFVFEASPKTWYTAVASDHYMTMLDDNGAEGWSLPRYSSDGDTLLLKPTRLSGDSLIIVVQTQSEYLLVKKLQLKELVELWESQVEVIE